MFITGPDVIKTVTHEDVSKQELGGAMTHNATSGVAHFIAADDNECLAMIRELMSFLPLNNLDDPPRRATSDPATRADAALDLLVPADPMQPYDIKDVIHSVADDRYFFEVHEHFAKNIVVGFCAAGGTAGRNRRESAGVFGWCSRYQRFGQGRAVRAILRTRSISRSSPFEDVPGFLSGTQQEWNGIIKHGAKLLYAFAEATVPKLTVITRKAYGGAYCVMSSKHLRTDANFAWPTAEIAVMGAEGAVNIVYKREFDRAPETSRESLRKEKIAEFRERFANPYVAAERGYIDAVIEPSQTRAKLITALRSLETKRDTNPKKKHGNIPL